MKIRKSRSLTDGQVLSKTGGNNRGESLQAVLRAIDQYSQTVKSLDIISPLVDVIR